MTTVEGDIDTLSRAILGEAQAEIEELKGKSQAKADVILQRAKATAEQQRAEILERARQEARRLKDQSTATAQLKSRTLELEHREKLLQRVFDGAGSRIHELTSRKDYPESTLALLREALDQLHTDSAVIRADKASRAVLTETVLQQISSEMGLELQMGDLLDTGTGILVQSKDGRLQFDNTLENRIERLRGSLRADVYRVLTGESA
ncbi:MAG TPA: V-type ATP synthase subunit E family protein [Anaerolineales bacterium]|nr:V-type ATP synthase subunit E family protein [Anaerolineales bacterium]